MIMASRSLFLNSGIGWQIARVAIVCFNVFAIVSFGSYRVPVSSLLLIVISALSLLFSCGSARRALSQIDIFF